MFTTSSPDNMLRGLFVMSDKPNRSLILTTEQTSRENMVLFIFVLPNASAYYSFIIYSTVMYVQYILVPFGWGL